MSPTARAAAAAGAVLVIAVGGFLVLRPDDGDGGSGGAATTAPAATTTTAPATTRTTTRTAPPKAVADVPVIKVRGGAPVGGVERIEVSKGETVRFRVSADTPQSVHVHGYELEREASPGSPATFRFKAGIEGRFEVESHTSGVQLGEITVNP